MNDFLYAHKKSWTNKSGQDLTLFIDVNLKKNILTSIRFTGFLVPQYANEILEIVSAFSDKSLDTISTILINNSLPLSLFYKTLDEYQGNIPVEHLDLVCLCFGITKFNLEKGVPTMAGRACGSCGTLIKKREFQKIAGMYPGPLLVKLDSLKQDWSQNKNISISLLSIVNNYLEVKIIPYDRDILKSLSDYYFEKLNTRIFLRATL